MPPGFSTLPRKSLTFFSSSVGRLCGGIPRLSGVALGIRQRFLYLRWRLLSSDSLFLTIALAKHDKVPLHTTTSGWRPLPAYNGVAGWEFRTHRYPSSPASLVQPLVLMMTAIQVFDSCCLEVNSAPLLEKPLGKFEFRDKSSSGSSNYSRNLARCLVTLYLVLPHRVPFFGVRSVHLSSKALAEAYATIRFANVGARYSPTCSTACKATIT